MKLGVTGFIVGRSLFQNQDYYTMVAGLKKAIRSSATVWNCNAPIGWYMVNRIQGKANSLISMSWLSRCWIREYETDKLRFARLSWNSLSIQNSSLSNVNQWRQSQRHSSHHQDQRWKRRMPSNSAWFWQWENRHTVASVRENEGDHAKYSFQYDCFCWATIIKLKLLTVVR